MNKEKIENKNTKPNTTKELIKKCKNNGNPLDCGFCKYNGDKECPFYRFRE